MSASKRFEPMLCMCKQHDTQISIHICIKSVDQYTQMVICIVYLCSAFVAATAAAAGRQTSMR